MGNWVKVDPEQFEEQSPGVEFRVFVSPYDIPEAVRGDYDEEDELFVIEFEYIQDEETETKRLDENVSVQLGKNSGRIRTIQVDVHELGAHEVRLRLATDAVENAYGRLAGERTQASSTNYDVTHEIIEDHLPTLLEPLQRARA